MLSGPHQRFAQGIASGLNATKAYQAAYPKVKVTTAGANGHELLKNTEIQAEITRLRAKVEAKFTMTQAQWLERLLSVADKAELAADFASTKGCLREIGLAMPGWYAAGKVSVSAEGDLMESLASALGSIRK
jgi:phage terminase small subunit